MDGRFVGRTQISTKAYMSPSVTETRLRQTLTGRQLDALSGNQSKRTLFLTAYAKLEAMHVLPGSRWTVRLMMETSDKKRMMEESSFDFGSQEWQARTVSLCIAPWITIESIRVEGSLDGFRGAVLWDQWILRLE
jgi:hypothetical protein